MSDSKPGMLSDLVKGALTTAITLIVTFFVTSAIKKDQYQQSDADKEKQRMESLEKTSKLLSDYVSRYDSLHAKYINLLDQKVNGNANIAAEDNKYSDNNSNRNSFTAVSQSLLNGNWITPDGSYAWSFSNNKLNIRGLGTYADSYAASGTYEAAGGRISGAYNVAKFMYIPVNINFKFEATLNTDENILYGTMTDGDGNSNTLTLYKN